MFDIRRYGFRALNRAGYPRAAERVLLHGVSTPKRSALVSENILIAGVPRVGKTTIAVAVARALRMRAFSTDDLGRIRDEDEVPSIMAQVCEMASGLVVEGKALIPLVLEQTAISARNHVFAVGCCDSSPEKWEEVLRADSDWPSRRPPEYIRRFAQDASEQNRQVRDKAIAAGIEYFEIPREDFSAAIERTVNAIVGRVRPFSQ